MEPRVRLVRSTRLPVLRRRPGALCPIIGFNRTVGGKYNLRLLYELKDGVARYGELRRALVEATLEKTITPRVLSRELKELQARGLIWRKQYPVVPPKVEYGLTARGRSLVPVIEAMMYWSLGLL
jgi:DNA-binding HxlR family transcriptional regulator